VDNVTDDKQGSVAGVAGADADADFRTPALIAVCKFIAPVASEFDEKLRFSNSPNLILKYPTKVTTIQSSFSSPSGKISKNPRRLRDTMPSFAGR
jgi:hypothetical protein